MPWPYPWGRGLNILFNRATNDIPMTADEVRLRAELQRAHVHELAERLPDLDPNAPEFWPCLSLATRNVRQLACRNVASFQPQSANVGRTLARLGVQLPIVLTEDDEVVNGIGRLEAAARKDRETIEAITVSPVKAELARAMLNLLSMDFHFEGDNAIWGLPPQQDETPHVGDSLCHPCFPQPPQRRL